MKHGKIHGFIMQHRFFGTLFRFVCHPGQIRPPILHQIVLQRSLLRMHSAAKDGIIPLFHRSILNLSAQIGSRLLRLRINHHAADGSVQPVNHPDIARPAAGFSIKIIADFTFQIHRKSPSSLGFHSGRFSHYNHRFIFHHNIQHHGLPFQLSFTDSPSDREREAPETGHRLPFPARSEDRATDGELSWFGSLGHPLSYRYFFKISTLSSFSHGKSRSSLPK